MARSMAITASGTATQKGTEKWLSSPHPWAAAVAASPTAATGNSRRSRMVLSTTSPRLLPQRRALETVRARRGARSSQRAMRAKMPKKAPRRMAASWVWMKVSKVGLPLVAGPAVGVR